MITIRAELQDIFWLIPDKKHSGVLKPRQYLQTHSEVITFETEEEWRLASEGYEMQIGYDF